MAAGALVARWSVRAGAFHVLVDHGAWTRTAIITASMVDKAEQRAGVTVVPTVPPMRLFAAIDDGLIVNSLAEFLHDLYPKTVHPPKPTRLA